MDMEDRRRYFIFESVILEICTPLFRKRVKNDNRNNSLKSFQNFLNSQPVACIMDKNALCCQNQGNSKNNMALPLHYNLAMTPINFLMHSHLCYCNNIANSLCSTDEDLILQNHSKLRLEENKAIKTVPICRSDYLHHNTDSCITEDEYARLWTDLEWQVQQLENSKQDDCVTIQNRSLDESLYKKYTERLIDLDLESCVNNEHEKKMYVEKWLYKDKIQKLENDYKPCHKSSELKEDISRNEEENCHDISIAKQERSIFDAINNDDYTIDNGIVFKNIRGKIENRMQITLGSTVKLSETEHGPEVNFYFKRTAGSCNKVWKPMDEDEEKHDQVEDKNSDFVKINTDENILIQEEERFEMCVENFDPLENITTIPFDEEGAQQIHLCKEDFVDRTKCSLNLEKSHVCIEKSDSLGSGICKRRRDSESINNDNTEENKRSTINPSIDHGDKTDVKRCTSTASVSNFIGIKIWIILLLFPSFAMSSYTSKVNDTLFSQQFRSRSSNEMIDFRLKSSEILLDANRLVAIEIFNKIMYNLTRLITDAEEYTNTAVVESLNVYQHWVWGFSVKKNQMNQKIETRESKASSSKATVYVPLAPDLKSKVLLDLSQLKAFSQDVPQRKKRTDGDTSHDLILYRVFLGIGFIMLAIELIVSSIYGRQFLLKKVFDLEPWEIVVWALSCIVTRAALVGIIYLVDRTRKLQQLCHELVDASLTYIVIHAALVGHICLVVRTTKLTTLCHIVVEFALPCIVMHAALDCIVILAALVGQVCLDVRTTKLQQLCHMEWKSATRIMNSLSYRRSQVCYFSRSAIYNIWRFLLSTGKCFAGFAKNILFWMTKMIFRKATAIDYKLLFMRISDVLMIFVKVITKLVRIIIVIIKTVGKEYQLNDFDNCGNETKLQQSCSDTCTFKTLNTDDAGYNELKNRCKLCETTEYKERCKEVQVNLIIVGWNTTESLSSCQGKISSTEVTYEKINAVETSEGSDYTDKIDHKDIILENKIDTTNHDTTLQDTNDYNSEDEKTCFVSVSVGNHGNINETEHFVSPNDLEYDSLRNEEKNKFYKKEKIMLRDLSLSSSVTTEHHSVLPNNDIHAETAVKEIYVDPDESSYMNVELTDSVELSIDEFNNSDRRHCVGKTANGSAVQMCTDNAENESIHSSRSSEMEDYTEQIINDVESLHEDDDTTRFNSKVWSSPSYNKFCLEKDTELCNSMKSGMSDMKSNSLKVDKSFSSSLHSGSCCSCLTDTHVYNCQFEIQHHSGPQLILDYKDDIQPASSTVFDLQKRQELKSQSLEKETKPSMNEQEKNVTMRDDEIAELVKNTIRNLVGEEISKVTKRLKSGKRCSKVCRKAAVKRMSRRRLRRIIYPIGNICNVKTDIEARPHLNVPQTNAASNRHARELDAAAAVALPRPVLTTSLPSSTNSLNSYFTKMMSGHEFSTEEKMQYEMLRVQSFQDLPASCRVSPLRLARTGFFSAGISDEVNCFSCGVRYKGWQGGDNPSEIHRRISPDCRMVNGREARNIPAIPPSNGIIESSAHQESLANSSIGLVQTTIHPDGDMSTQTVSNRALTREEIQNGNVADTTLQSRNAIQQPFANQQYTRQPAIDRSHSVTEGEQNRPAHRDTAEELGITLDRPKYPAYAQLNVRVSTFQGWPGYLDQTPRDMALAGFFYAGYNDYCRCFFCGGGLRNWDAGDDPWVEHARWFSKCAFVRQNRGHRFVEIIVKRQAEMEAAGNTSGSASSHTSVTHSETESRNQTTAQAGAQSGEKSSTTDPAVESVKEIGYSDEIIQRAISIIRQSNPGKERIEATEILEIIFTIADDNNTQTNAAVPSDNTPASTLNLPGQQVSQPNVSSVPVSTQSSASNQRPGVPSQSGNAAESSLPSLSVSSLELGNAGSKSEQSGAGKEISENDIRSLQEENIQLKEQVMCKICMDKNVSIAFLPCGHLACCIDCAPAMRKCPMCRVYIKGTVKTYLA